MTQKYEFTIFPPQKKRNLLKAAMLELLPQSFLASSEPGTKWF